LGLWVAPDPKSVRPLAATIPSRLLSGTPHPQKGGANL